MPSAWRSPGASAAPCCPESGCKSGRHRVNADGDVAVGHSVHGRRVHSALTPAPCSWAAASRHCLGAQDSTSSCRRATHRVTRDHSPLDRGWYPSASPSFTARDGLDPPSEPGAPAPGVYIHRPRLGLACRSLTDLGRVERGRSWWISRCARRLGRACRCAPRRSRSGATATCTSSRKSLGPSCKACPRGRRPVPDGGPSRWRSERSGPGLTHRCAAGGGP